MSHDVVNIKLNKGDNSNPSLGQGTVPNQEGSKFVKEALYRSHILLHHGHCLEYFRPAAQADLMWFSIVVAEKSFQCDALTKWKYVEIQEEGSRFVKEALYRSHRLLHQGHCS